MKTSEEIALLTDEELVAYGDDISIIAKKDIEEIQKSHNVLGGVLNYRGEGKEYLNVDLKSYCEAYVGMVEKYILPIEKELRKRVKGDGSYYSEIHGKTYKNLNIDRLEYFSENIRNAYIGRISPKLCNPHWYTHLKRIVRYYKQPDYQEKIKSENRENNIDIILEHEQ